MRKRLSVFLSMIICSMSSVNIGATVPKIDQSHTDWFSEAGYGLFIHWTSQSGAKDGVQSSYEEAVNNFNVEAFAQQVEESGAGYVIFSIAHAQQYLAFPSEKMDSVLEGRTTTRDLYAEMYDALNPKGIEMMFYYPSVGDKEDPEWQKASKYVTDKEAFCEMTYDLVEEIGLRYGEKLAGWWIDNAFDKDLPGGEYRGQGYEWDRYANSLRVGNEKRIIAFNHSGQSEWDSTTSIGLVDYQAGEDGGSLQRIPESRFAGEGNSQWHTCAPMDERAWVHYGGAKTPTPRFETGRVIKYIEDVMSKGGVFSYNCAVYQDGSISEATMNQLRDIKAAVRDGIPYSSSYINDNNEEIIYKGKWKGSTNRDVGDYGDDVHYTTIDGDSFEYIFAGEKIEFITEKNVDMGKVDIYIDDVFVESVDCYNPVRLAQQTVFEMEGLEPGIHRIKGVKRSGKYMLVDALKAKRVQMINNDNQQIQYIGEWKRSINRGAGDYQNDVHYTTTTGSALFLEFKGTGVEIVGPKDSGQGSIYVYVNDRLMEVVNTISNVYMPQQVIYQVQGLPEGKNTIRLEMIDGRWMQLDAIRIATD